MKVAIYIRVSTKDKQDITKQRDFLLNYINNQPEMELFKVYEDRGVSGSKSTRPGLNELLEDLSECDAVLVYKMDRIGRSFKNLFELMELFKENNIDFISATQPIDTTRPEGKLFFNMLASFSEFEREMIVQRINDGLAIAKSRGKKLGRPVGAKDRKKRQKVGYYMRWNRERNK